MRKHPWRIAAPALVVVLAMAAALAGCGSDATTTTTTAAPVTETTADGGNTVDAAALYSANCESCHGADGSGNIGPDLRTHDDAAAVATQIAQGGGAMPAFADKLSADEIAALADFVVGLE
ncbi:MAG: c-type cytochrome [Thermoleophilia bacterium]